MAEKNIVKLTLSNGMNVEFDTSLADGRLLMKCRTASGGAATVIYLIAEIGTFNGEKLAAEEILKFSAFDIIDLEEAWAKQKK